MESKEGEGAKAGALKKILLGSVIGGAAVVSTPVVLYAAGFSSIGPIGGSLAAKWMAGSAICGGIKSGSVYAILQSTAMTGAVVSGKSIVAGGLVGSVLGVAEGMKSMWRLAGRASPVDPHQ